MSEDQALPPEQSTADVAGGHLVEDIESSVETSGQLRTGDAQVDSVISDVAGIGERPLDEHPAAFEDAHERLRRALDGSGDEQPAPE